MDEATLWEIIEGFEKNGNLRFTLIKWIDGWMAYFGKEPKDGKVFKTRKEALIHAIAKLKGQK